MNWTARFQEKCLDPKELSKKVEELKRDKKTIATVNGTFDLLHAGHLHLLFETAQQAEICLVALNSDASVKSYKSASRPFIPLQERLQLIAALEWVDYVTWFEELDPRRLLEIVRPDVHVNGAEYRDCCIEAPVVEAGGGRVHFVSLLPGLSTTAIAKRVSAL